MMKKKEQIINDFTRYLNAIYSDRDIPFYETYIEIKDAADLAFEEIYKAGILEGIKRSQIALNHLEARLK